MAVDIFRIDLGFDQCYVLKSEGVIAKDAGAPDKGRDFARGLERASISPQDVQLIVISHRSLVITFDLRVSSKQLPVLSSPCIKTKLTGSNSPSRRYPLESSLWEPHIY